MRAERTSGQGHVFVIHGDVTKVAADGIVIPCDRSQDISRHWSPYYRAPGDHSFWQQGSPRVSRPFGELSPPLDVPLPGRFVDTGATRSTAHPTWLHEGVRDALGLVASDISASEPANGRARRLLAIPLVGTGAGGFDKVRGEALDAVCRAANDCALEHSVDVVIVCWKRSDYAALQSLRARQSEWSALSEAEVEEAGRLAAVLRSGQLVLFLGAGVSMAAGLPGFDELLDRLGAPTRAEGKSRRLTPGERAELLFSARGRSLKALKAKLRAELSRDHYALGHGLLASLRVEETITTNFDVLFESACERPLFPDELEVLPGNVAPSRRPWLLKAHGDINDDHPVVISKSDFDAFTAEHGPIASIMQASMVLNREILFVGYSVRDPNVRALASAARNWHRTRRVERRTIGTVLEVRAKPSARNDGMIRRLSLARDREEFAQGARRLEIFLDRIAWAAAQNEGSWLLDPRYKVLLESSEVKLAEQLRGLDVPRTEAWRGLREALAGIGREPS